MTLDADALAGSLDDSCDIALATKGTDSLWLLARESGGSGVPRLNAGLRGPRPGHETAVPRWPPRSRPLASRGRLRRRVTRGATAVGLRAVRDGGGFGSAAAAAAGETTGAARAGAVGACRLLQPAHRKQGGTKRAADLPMVPKPNSPPPPAPSARTQKGYLVDRVPRGTDPAAVLKAGQAACSRIKSTAELDRKAAVSALKSGEIPNAEPAVEHLCPTFRPLLRDAGLTD